MPTMTVSPSQAAEELQLELPAAASPDAGMAAGPVGSRQLPFPFAKRHGVLVLGTEDGHARLLVRSGARPQAIAEARRFLGLPLLLYSAAAEEFDARLQETYERESNSTICMVELDSRS